MEIVLDVDHYGGLIKQFTGNRNNITNCYLVPAGIHRYTHNRQMYWEKLQNGIIFLCEESDFYYLYYYLNDTKIVLPQTWGKNFNKPVIIDLVYQEPGAPQNLLEIEDQLILCGFQRYKRYQRMALDLTKKEKLFVKTAPEKGNRYVVRLPQQSDCDAIQLIWRDNLDIYSTPMPGREDLCELINAEQVICGYEKSGKLIAALHIGVRGNVGSIERIAVMEGYRRYGLAQELVNHAFSLNSQLKRYFLWVDENNLPAIRFYLKNGFAFDGKRNTQLIMKPAKNRSQTTMKARTLNGKTASNTLKY